MTIEVDLRLANVELQNAWRQQQGRRYNSGKAAAAAAAADDDDDYDDDDKQEETSLLAIVHLSTERTLTQHLVSNVAFHLTSKFLETPLSITERHKSAHVDNEHQTNALFMSDAV